jgi:hypothetical protein
MAYFRGNFLNQSKWIDELKLRASWGKSGFYGNTDPANQYTLYGYSPTLLIMIYPVLVTVLARDTGCSHWRPQYRLAGGYCNKYWL